MKLQEIFCFEIFQNNPYKKTCILPSFLFEKYDMARIRRKVQYPRDRALLLMRSLHAAGYIIFLVDHSTYSLVGTFSMIIMIIIKSIK